jgi:hypothetical protein
LSRDVQEISEKVQEFLYKRAKGGFSEPSPIIIRIKAKGGKK